MSDERRECDAQFELLLNQYEKLVFSICYRMTGDYFEAEDLTQETFLSLYKALPNYDGKNPGGFVTRIASNKCLDYLKSAQRRAKPVEDTMLEQNSSSVPPPEEQMMKQEVKQDLRRVCQNLKPPYSEVAMSYFYDGKTAGEIAEQSGKKVKTVQTQIRRARSMLRKLLKKEELLWRT